MLQKTTTFKTKLAAYKQLIDADIARYAKQVQKETLENFTAHSRVATDAYLEMLGRGGKRIRGALTMLGYEMCGGTDQAMIIQAARAVEMVHAYILMIDDIQDRSPTRRGGPTAHTMLADYHKKHNLADGSEHFGIAMALNAALFGCHSAEVTLINLDVTEPVRLKALNIFNRTMITTVHGQTNDIFNELVSEVSEADVNNVIEWKTAHYTFLNPLHMGMVLADADERTQAAITDYALQAGHAFQITDDILGVFGNEFESGKSPLDDIREGKRTLLTVRALETAAKADKNFLIQMLGNHQLTPAEFDRCKEITVDCGALAYAQAAAAGHVQQAIAALDRHAEDWSPEGTTFLRELATFLLTRTA